MRTLLAALLVSCAIGRAGTVFLPAYPHHVIAVNEADGKVTDVIPLETGMPLNIRLSDDRKFIYVATVDHNGIEVIDVAARKVVNHFVLDSARKQYRFNWMGGGTPDSSNKFYYTVTREITKGVDRFEADKPKYSVIDLAQQKIVRTADVAPEDEAANEGGPGRGGFDISPDGKYLYQFRDSVVVIDTSDFKVVQRIPLAKPELEAVENLNFGAALPSIHDPGQRTSLFFSADPYVHNRIFGIGRFDLNSRQFSFAPIGPAPAAMFGLEVTPDRKTAYSVITSGRLGTRRCEFWAFDLQSDRVSQTSEVHCHSRFTFGMSSDGKKLYMYGEGFEIDVYDAATMKHEATWDLGRDVTYGGIVVIP